MASRALLRWAPMHLSAFVPDAELSKEENQRLRRRERNARKRLRRARRS